MLTQCINVSYTPTAIELQALRSGRRAFNAGTTYVNVRTYSSLSLLWGGNLAAYFCDTKFLFPSVHESCGDSETSLSC